MTQRAASSGSLAKDRATTAQIGQMLLFFLTLLLSGMVLSQLIEEKSNKIIEVIAAAVPIDAMFVGKLFAMLAASVVGIIVWLSAGALLIQLIKHGGVATLPTPAVGWPGVPCARGHLFRAELSAARLGLPDDRRAGFDGARGPDALDAGDLRQVLIFGFASTAVGQPNSTEALAAAIFPLSSPMAMLARAAQDPAWWPHLVAIVWQAPGSR